MNTTKSVYNKLFSEDKTELSKHEVELALLDDLLNLNREAGSLLVLQKFQSGALPWGVDGSGNGADENLFLPAVYALGVINDRRTEAQTRGGGAPAPCGIATDAATPFFKPLSRVSG